jgi:hypothetical protein
MLPNSQNVIRALQGNYQTSTTSSTFTGGIHHIIVVKFMFRFTDLAARHKRQGVHKVEQFGAALHQDTSRQTHTDSSFKSGNVTVRDRCCCIPAIPSSAPRWKQRSMPNATKSQLRSSGTELLLSRLARAAAVTLSVMYRARENAPADSMVDATL